MPTSDIETCSSAGQRGPKSRDPDGHWSAGRTCRRRRARKHLVAPMVTTWPVLTEAMYLLGDAGGWPAQRALCGMIERDALVLAELQPADIVRARALMDKYRDAPMDIAD